MTESSAPAHRSPIVPPQASGFFRGFKRYLEDLGNPPTPAEIDPAKFAPYIAQHDLPTLPEYLEHMGFSPGDPIFTRVPADRTIYVADHVTCRNLKLPLENKTPVLQRPVGLQDQVLDLGDNKHLIFMPTPVEHMDTYMADSMRMPGQKMHGVNNLEFHTFVLMHEVGHCGQTPGPRAVMESGADVNGITATEDQFPGSNIRDVVLNYRFAQNGYRNGMVLDRMLKGDTSMPAETLIKAQINSRSETRNTLPVSLKDTFSELGLARAPQTDQDIQGLDRKLKAGIDDPLEREATERSLHGYKSLAPEATASALGQTPIGAITRAVTDLMRLG